MEPTSSFVRCIDPSGLHDMHYNTWPCTANLPGETVVCVHGLTRNSRDFDFIANKLTDLHTVVCPDVVGRGNSDWLIETEHYNYNQYTQDMVNLIAHLRCASLKWIGTSMGGVIGMMLASMTKSPIKALVLNDIGPFIRKSQSERVLSYVGVVPQFPNLKQARSYIEKVYASFGDLTPEQWQHMTDHSFFQTPEGVYRRNYDPSIAHNLKDRALSDINLWPNWANIHCPVMLIWGENSDYVSPDMVDKMRKIKPDLEVVFLPGVGHAPALMDEPTMEKIKNFLDQH